jgi:hypothetical protein
VYYEQVIPDDGISFGEPAEFLFQGEILVDAAGYSSEEYYDTMSSISSRSLRRYIEADDPFPTVLPIVTSLHRVAIYPSCIPIPSHFQFTSQQCGQTSHLLHTHIPSCILTIGIHIICLLCNSTIQRRCPSQNARHQPRNSIERSRVSSGHSNIVSR